MMSSKVPAAIKELTTPFYLPYPLSFKLIKPGTITDGLIQDIIYPRAKHRGIGIPKRPRAINAIVTDSMV